MMLAWVMAAALGSCAPPEGTGALLAQPQRIIVVGDSHGTTEGPAGFGEIACAAAEQGPLTVGLEMPESDQPLFDAVLAAPDEVTAARRLRSGEFGDPRANDGRHSQAMFDMILALWRLRAAGHDVAIRAFMPRMSVIHGRDQAWWELEMAYGMSRALAARPDARVLIFVGDLHARKTGFPLIPEIGLPAAGHLYAADTLTLHFAQQGGESWGCQSECGRHGSIAVYDGRARGIILEPTADGAYDGVFAVGPTTASPPAANTSSGSSS